MENKRQFISCAIGRKCVKVNEIHSQRKTCFLSLVCPCTWHEYKDSGLAKFNQVLYSKVYVVVSIGQFLDFNE